MDIKNLKNVGKLFNSEKDEKNENKGKNLPIADDSRKVDEKAYKNYSAAMKAATLAMLMAAAAGTTTSCVDQHGEQEVIIDNSELVALMAQLVADNAAQRAQMETVINLLKQLGTDNADIKKLLGSLVDLAGKQNQVLNDIKSGVMSIDEGIKALVTYAKQANEKDEEFLAKLDAIINSQASSEKKLEDINNAITEQNKILTNIAQIIANAGDKLSGQIDAFFKEYQNGSLTQTQLLEKIFAAIQNSNEINQEQLEKLDAIIAAIESGNIDRAEGLAQIADILSEINGKLDVIIDNMSTIIKGLDAYTTEIKDFKSEFKEFRKEWQAGNVSTQGFLAQVISALASLNCTDSNILSQIANLQTSVSNHTVSDQQAHAQVIALLTQISQNKDSYGDAIVAKLTQIENAINNGTMTEAAALAELADLLKQIDANTEGITDGLDQISSQISQLSQQIGSYQNKSLKLLAGIKGNTASINDKLNQVIKNQKENNKISLKMLNEMDAATKLLCKINGKTVTKSDLRNLLGDLFNQIEPYLKNIGNSEFDVSQIVEAIKESKVDLSETNAYLDVITGILKDMNLNGVDAVQGVIDKLNEIIEKGGADAGDIKALLQQALGELAGINGNTEKILETLKSIDGKVGSIDKKFDELLNNADKALAALNHIDKKQVTIQELKDLVGDYFNQIQPYLEKIGANGNGPIDLSDVIAAINAHKVDLTKTNALIETLTNVVQNLDFSGSTNYEPATLNKIYEILNKIYTDGSSDAAKAQDLLNDAIKLLQNIKTNGDSQLDVLNAILATAKEMKANQDQAFGAAVKAELNFYNKIDEIIDALNNGTGVSEQLKATLIKYGDAMINADNEAQQARAQQLAVLEAILANMGAGSGEGVTVEQLKQVIPDYTDILNEIADKIGKVVTSSDLQNFFLKTQPDLTKTNALIETLTNVVQNIDVSGAGGSADMSRVESLLGQILDVLNSGKQPTQAQVDDLIKAANQLVTNTASTRGVVASNGTYLAPEFNYYLGSHVSDDTIYLG